MSVNVPNRVDQAKPKFSVVINSDAYKKLINNTLGDPEVARKFVADISTVVSNNKLLQECEAGSIVSAGLTATALKLPLSQSLGFAYVVPYKTKEGTRLAQFQIGYKGLIQLAQRTGLYETIAVRPVHEGETQGQDEFGDEVIKFSHEFDEKPIVGYFAAFRLTNGFKKTIYWTKEQAEAHGRRYSKSFNKLWSESFDVMAQKTVLKQLISKFGPMSVDLENAIRKDQGVIREDGSVDYVDNPSYDDEPEDKRVVKSPVIENEPEEAPKADSMGEIVYPPLLDDDKPF